MLRHEDTMAPKVLADTDEKGIKSTAHRPREEAEITGREGTRYRQEHRSTHHPDTELGTNSSLFQFPESSS